ncbi:ABC transporter permease subunit [uncultured Bacteroides sp.]|uniref:ABC transporter permease subunit n=1 Tax=uncultured Bacteroides sp. TaxID=162156 RepID=UPI00339D2EEB
MPLLLPGSNSFSKLAGATKAVVGRNPNDWLHILTPSSYFSPSRPKQAISPSPSAWGAAKSNPLPHNCANKHQRYFDQIPDALIESAKIDGAGHWRIMTQVVFPMAVPGMISIAIYGFV